MKKTIVGALVGGVILFIWQFLTWGALNLHEAQQRYTPKQDSILAYLKTQFTEDGAYMMPTVAPGTSSKDMEAQMKACEGKPWAQVVYHKSMPGMDAMFMNMGRSYVIDFLVVALLCWLLVKIPSPSFGTVFLGSVFTGLIVFFNIPYTMHIWYGSFDLNAHLIDALISWGGTGLWLGWWLRRGKS
ncbi:MAG: hypothetical protein JST86_15100 [Bacteroidetes bacterium]|nr:hypothetical protein [Bacteroidota bacterium]